MRKKTKSPSLRALLFFGATLIPLQWGCDGNSFSGTSGQASKANPGTPDVGSSAPTGGTASDTSDNPSAAGSDCIKGDIVQIAFDGPEKACFDSNRTWNFSKGICQDIRKAKFDCTWDNILKWFAQTNLVPTEAIKNGQKEGRKVVSCGESEDSNRLVVIWLNPPKAGSVQCDSLKNIASQAVTGCYTFYPDPSKAPPKPLTDEDKSQQVYSCMEAL